MRGVSTAVGAPLSYHVSHTLPSYISYLTSAVESPRSKQHILAVTDPNSLALESAVSGAYRIERELGRGGMGAVFLARFVSALRHRPDTGQASQRFTRAVHTKAPSSISA